ncbi:hypothetical protein ACFQX7_27910 [Luedemannella flava]
MLELPWPKFVDTVQGLLPTWLPGFKFRDPTGDLEINIHQHIWSYESQPHVVWDDRKVRHTPRRSTLCTTLKGTCVLWSRPKLTAATGGHAVPRSSC